jgi:hypothetical protein
MSKAAPPDEGGTIVTVSDKKAVSDHLHVNEVLYGERFDLPTVWFVARCSVRRQRYY